MKKTFLLFASLSIVTIMQALTISNNTAGNLATAVGAELTTCTSLIVTGDIDARDFLTMKESMTALKTIDLSGATVIYYYGNGGTNGTSNQSYAPNDFPRNAFYYNTKLTSVILPNSITSIGNYAFDGCSSLTSVNIPSLVTSIGIGDGAFGGYSGLITVDTNNTKYSSVEGILYNKTQTTLIHCPPSKIGSVTILSSVNTINPTAFYKCISLTSITIPSLVNTIMDGAFNECRNLTSIKVFNSKPNNITIGVTIFTNVNKSTCTLYVPTGSTAAYKAAAQWQDFINIVEFNPNAIYTPEVGNYSISITSNLLTITNAPQGQSVMVYNINGAVISNQIATVSEVVVTLPAHGVYIVKVGSQSEKMVY